jgi:hypothetical protein
MTFLSLIFDASSPSPTSGTDELGAPEYHMDKCLHGAVVYFFLFIFTNATIPMLGATLFYHCLLLENSEQGRLLLT